MIHNWETGQNAFICVKYKSSQRQAVLQPYVYTEYLQTQTCTQKHTHTYIIQYQGHVSVYDLDLHPLSWLLFSVSGGPSISSVSSKAASTNVITVPTASKPRGTVSWFLRDKQGVPNCRPSGCRRDEITWHSSTHSHIRTNPLPWRTLRHCKGIWMKWELNYQTENSHRVEQQALLPQHNLRSVCNLSLFNVFQSWTFLFSFLTPLHFFLFCTFCCTVRD